MNMPTEKPFHQFRNSGAQARTWKRKISLLASRAKDTMRTLKFPLDIPESDLSKLPEAQFGEAYNTIEGTGAGTLFDFWAKIILAGFRVFPKSGAATIFRQQALFKDAEWNAAFREQTGKDWLWLVPSVMFNRFTTQPKEVTLKSGGKKDIAFTPDNVANECHKTFLVTSMTDKTTADVREFFVKLGAALAAEFGSWKEANEDLELPMQVLDRVIREYATVPSLADMARRYEPDTQPRNATIAWGGLPGMASKSIAPFIFASAAARYGKEPDGKLGAFVQENVTTTNATGLSWLFGVGLEYFRTAGLDRIMQDFDISQNAKDAVDSVRQSASAIPPISVFGKKSYAGFRTAFQGKIDSWIANYANRLLQLKALAAEIEPGFVLPQALLEDKDSFIGLDMSPSDVVLLISEVYRENEAVQAAIAILLGQKPGDIDGAVFLVEEYSTLIDTLHGILRMLESRLIIRRDAAGSADKEAIENIKPQEFKLPKWLDTVPKLVGISGGLPAPEKEVELLASEFNSVMAKMQARYQRILAYVVLTGHTPDPYVEIAKRETKLLELVEKKQVPPARAKAQAYRNVMHRVGKAVQGCSEATKKQFVKIVREAEVFHRPSLINLFIFNQKGAIYRNPFDRSRHTAYQIRTDKLIEHDWLQVCRGIVSALREKGGKAGLEDAMRLERTIVSIEMSGLPDIDYPSDLATPDIDGVDVPVVLQLHLRNADVSRDVLQRAFNLYMSKLSGLSFKVLREYFTVKLTFHVGDDTELIYSPKTRVWSIPERYRASEGLLRIAAEAVMNAYPDGGAITPADMHKALPSDTAVRGVFFQQAPHDWYFDLSWAGREIEGYPTVKGEIADKVKKRTGYRLIGKSSYKTVLDRSLIGLTELKRSSVIIELPYQQHLAMDNGKYCVRLEKLPPRVSLTIPLSEHLEEKHRVKDESLLFDRLIGIDLGETGIGFAVLDAKTGEKIESGFRRIPSIRNLLRRTWHYENRPNERQRFQAKHNMNMSDLRDNIVGDVCHQINRLCAYYKAFPVLEFMSGVRNKQLSSVYDSVTHRYVWSSTDAHKADRVTFWLGGEAWQHPYLKGKDGKPVLLSPGRGVSSKGNSQRCSGCGRNAIDLIKSLKPKEKIAVLDGKTTIGGHSLALFEESRETTEDAKSRASKNKRKGLVAPLESGNYTADELRRIIYRNMRRAPENKHSPDTTVSRYFCVFEDCRKTLNADENGAINTAQKFMLEGVAK